MKKCILFEKAGGNSVKCLACRHYCVIPEGGTGVCSVRFNDKGVLKLLVYGRPAALAVDPIEKKPLFHFLPATRILSLGTIGCNFKCSFCQNWDISQPFNDEKEETGKKPSAERIQKIIDVFSRNASPEHIVNMALSMDIPSLAFTYNEPAIFFEFAFDTIKLGEKHGLKSVFVTNGYDSLEGMKKLKGRLSAYNIDLKSFSNDFYLKICGAKLDNVLQGIEDAFRKKFWLEITTLIIPGKNDSKEELKEIAGFISSLSNEIPWHVTAFHPDYKMADGESTGKEKLFEAFETGKNAGLDYVYVGNVDDERHESTCCPECNALLIKRNQLSVIPAGIDFKGKCPSCGFKVPGVWE